MPPMGAGPLRGLGWYFRPSLGWEGTCPNMPKMKTPKNPFRGVGQKVGIPDRLLDLVGASDSMDPSDVAPSPLGVAALPPKTLKEIGKMLLESIQDPRVKAAFGQFQSLYPRVAGTIDQVIEGKPGKGIAAASQGRGFPMSSTVSEAEHVPTAIRRWGKHGSIQVDPDSPTLFDDLFHEGKHTGQGIADPNFARKYDFMNREVGYDLNPYEIAARKNKGVTAQEAERLGTTLGDMTKGKAEAAAYRRRPIPASMAEFQPMPEGDVNPIDLLLPQPSHPRQAPARPAADEAWEKFMALVRARPK